MIGVLTDDTDPMVSVMKLEKAPQETYADIGGLDTQIQEIKASNSHHYHTASCDPLGECRVTINTSGVL